MSTRSYIAVSTPEGFLAAYCHFDGHLVGRTLQDYYSTPEAAAELVGLGNMSYLEPTLEQSCFYGRDRGEKNQGAVTMSKTALLRNSAGVSYVYIFEEGAWTTYIESKGYFMHKIKHVA